MLENKAFLLNSQTQKIRSLQIDKNLLQKTLQVLQERNNEAGRLEIEKYQRPDGETDEEHATKTQKILEGFELHVSILGRDGQRLTGPLNEIFESPNFPDEVLGVSMDSKIPLKVLHGWSVRNSMSLVLDFTKPEVFNFSLSPSTETSNASRFTVEGDNATWVNGVFNEFNNMLQKNAARFTWLHRHSIYDLIVLLVGLPLSFWVCYRSTEFFSNNFSLSPGFLQNMIYVYLFFFTLSGLRALFHYARWIWPLIEYRDQKNSSVKHRAIWTTIVLGITTTLIYDFIASFFQGIW